MKLPITKIKKYLRRLGYTFTEVEISYWNHKDPEADSTANMLNMAPDSDLVDIGTLARRDVDQVEDDGAGLAQIEFRTLEGDYGSVSYVPLFVFDGEVYKELPSGLSTELQRQIYLVAKAKK